MKEGINKLSEVEAHKTKTGALSGFQGSTDIAGSELVALPVDILVPSALENSLTAENASSVQAKIIVELANGPTTPEADELFRTKGITVIPDILANAGGVVVSYFEWYQNMHNETWKKNEVLKKLEGKMRTAASLVYRTARTRDTTLRDAGYVVALERLAAN